MKPDGPVFDATWRRESWLRVCSVADIEPFIRAHYLGKRPGVCVLTLELLRKQTPLGGIVFALPPPETAKRYGGVTWELARLYMLDDVPKNAETYFIAAALRHVATNHPEVRFVVSYADPSAGHSGTIYRAANFAADGVTDEGRSTPRFDLVGPDGKKYGRAAHVPDGVAVVRRPRISKIRYVYRMPPSRRMKAKSGPVQLSLFPPPETPA